MGFARDTEKKYFDKSIFGLGNELEQIIGEPMTAVASVAVYKSKGFWGVTTPGSNSTPQASKYAQDLFKGLPQGTTATSRMGNVINVKYVKGNITVTANVMSNKPTSHDNAQYGEAVGQPVKENGSLNQYVRTTYRVAVVRDLQVNSASTMITWEDVFSSDDGTGGVHSELNVGNMGRFRVLADKIVNLDGDDTQKTIPFLFRNMGRVRYNGASGLGEGNVALTDSGLYIVYATLTTGVVPGDMGQNVRVWSSPVIVNSRVCFTDA